MRASLVVVQGNKPGATLPIHSERFVIGRDPRCHLRPRSGKVSHIHCLLSREGERLTIRDMGSTNGTHLNGQRLNAGRSYPVRDGDQFTLGPLTFRILIEAEQAPSDLGEDIGFAVPGDSGTHRNELPVGMMTVSEMAVERIGEDEAPAAASGDKASCEGSLVRETPDYEIRKVRGITVVMPRGGRIVLDTDAEALRDLLFSLINETEPPRLLLDLAEVRYLASAALGVLAVVLGRVREEGGRLKLCRVRPELLRLFQTIGLDQWLPIEPDRAAALAGEW